MQPCDFLKKNKTLPCWTAPSPRYIQINKARHGKAIEEGLVESTKSTLFQKLKKRGNHGYLVEYVRYKPGGFKKNYVNNHIIYSHIITDVTLYIVIHIYT